MHVFVVRKIVTHLQAPEDRFWIIPRCFLLLYSKNKPLNNIFLRIFLQQMFKVTTARRAQIESRLQITTTDF